MSINHHLLGKVATDSILAKFKSGAWKCCGNAGTNFYRVGCDASFPSPDAAFYDDSQKLLVSFEFKPPTENKRGILTGLGQSIAYLKSSNIAYLIVPKKLEDFEIGNYMDELYSGQINGRIPVGFIIYDNENPEQVNMIHNITTLGKKLEFSPGSTERFWAKHQDLPIPLFHLILHCYYLKKIGIVHEDAFAHCWKSCLIPEKTIDLLQPAIVKDFFGKPIKTVAGTKNISFLEKKINAAKKLSGVDKENAILSLKQDAKTNFVGDNYFNSIKKNFVTFIKHLGLIDSTGNLTEDGFKVYHLGLANGPNSKIFKDYFLKYVLINGHHIDLIFDIDKLCNKYRGEKDFSQIKSIMLNEYESKGMIKRNPHRKVGEKSTVGFLKYELILWNSMGLLIKTNGKPNVSFNWKKIVDVCSLPEL